MKKFSEIVNDSISIKDLSKIKGGATEGGYCNTSICISRIHPSNECNGAAVCTNQVIGVIIIEQPEGPPPFFPSPIVKPA